MRRYTNVSADVVLVKVFDCDDPHIREVVTIEIAPGSHADIDHNNIPEREALAFLLRRGAMTEGSVPEEPEEELP